MWGEKNIGLGLAYPFFMGDLADNFEPGSHFASYLSLVISNANNYPLHLGFGVRVFLKTSGKSSSDFKDIEAKYISIENGVEVDYLMENVTSNLELITTIDQVRTDIVN